MASVDLGRQTKVISFTLGDSIFGIDILDVSQIIRATTTTKLFKSAAFIEGIINLRGEVIPLINLSKRLDMDQSPVSDETRFIVIELKGRRIGLVVDSVTQIVDLTGDRSVSSPADIAGLKPEYIREMSKTEEGLLIVLDLEEVLFPDGATPTRPEGQPALKKTESGAAVKEIRPQVESQELREIQTKLGERPNLKSFLSPKLREKAEQDRLQEPLPSQEKPIAPAVEDAPVVATPDLPPPEQEEEKPPLPQETSVTESEVKGDLSRPQETEKVSMQWEEAKPPAPSSEALEIGWEEAVVSTVAGKAHELSWEESVAPPVEGNALEIGWESPLLALEWEEADPQTPASEALEIGWEEAVVSPVEGKAYELSWESPLLVLEWEEALDQAPAGEGLEITWEEAVVSPVEGKAYELSWEESIAPPAEKAFEIKQDDLLKLEWEEGGQPLDLPLEETDISVETGVSVETDVSLEELKEELYEPPEEIASISTQPVVAEAEDEGKEETEIPGELTWDVRPIEVIRGLSISLRWVEEVEPGAEVSPSGEVVSPDGEVSDETTIEVYLEEVLYGKLAEVIGETSQFEESPDQDALLESKAALVGSDEKTDEKTIVDEFLGNL